jgi:GT2 family glycosyltransferase
MIDKVESIRPLTHAYAHVIDIELTAPFAGIQQIAPDGIKADKAWALVRLFGEPLGLDALSIPAEGLSSEAAEALILGHRSVLLAEHLRVNVQGTDPAAIRDALRTTKDTAFSRAHAEFVGRAQRCSVVVCTRDRPDDLSRCLKSLTTQDHLNFAVWVVDNAPTNESTRQVADSFSSDLDIRYVVEPRPGLSRARNAALGEALEGDLVAWLDDDEVADSQWLSELARAFDERPEVVAASGAVIPAELVTSAQSWFEQFGGHSKGRGFTVDEFSPTTWRRQHPLYPLPPFGVGANMAFRTDALRSSAGFDEALGAGTPAQAGEDTRMFTDLLLAGGTVLYWPSAITRHFHRRDLDGLRRQIRGYGSGLTGFYTASVLARPSTAISLCRLAPRALLDLFSPDSLRVATLEDDFPRDLLAENRRGLAAGPWLYMRGRGHKWFTDRQRW